MDNNREMIILILPNPIPYMYIPQVCKIRVLYYKPNSFCQILNLLMLFSIYCVNKVFGYFLLFIDAFTSEMIWCLIMKLITLLMMTSLRLKVCRLSTLCNADTIFLNTELHVS